MLLSMLNLGAFAHTSAFAVYGDSAMNAGAIYNMINLPIKIVSDLFNENKAFSDNEGDDNENKYNNTFALLVPVKQEKKSDGMFLTNAFIPDTGSGGRTFLEYSGAANFFLSDTFTIHFLANCSIAKSLLFLLMIMIVLPRGIPVKIKKFINIKFAFPVFIVNKAGIFLFSNERKGRLG